MNESTTRTDNPLSTDAHAGTGANESVKNLRVNFPIPRKAFLQELQCVRLLEIFGP